MATLEQRIDALEKLVKYALSIIDDNKFNAKADSEACVSASDIQSKLIDTNANDISDNRQGIEESFESSLTNADDIADVRTALEEVYELIANEEE